MPDYSQTKESTNVEKQANSIVLFTVLGINAAIAIVASIFQASSVSEALGLKFGEVYMENTFDGAGLIYTGTVLLMLIVLILNRVNFFIGSKVPLAESLIRILLRLPVNFILVCSALWIAWMAWAKSQAPGSEMFLGPLVVDIALIIGFLFLTFFVKKI